MKELKNENSQLKKQVLALKMGGKNHFKNI